MSIIINPDDLEHPLTVHEVRTGPTWELITVKGMGNDKKKVKLWVNNHPSGLDRGDKFYVSRIRKYKLTSQKLPDGRWVDDQALTVDVRREKLSASEKKFIKSGGDNWKEPPKPEWHPSEEPVLVDVDEDDEGLPF